MRYKINSTVAYTRQMKIKVFLRWLFYFLTLIILYALMSCGVFGLWQPYMIFGLAIGVSMREQEFSSSIFGIFCGFFIDMAMNSLFGFYAVFIMPCCFITSLLSRNLIKVNILNHILFTSASAFISFSMYYIFHYFVWNTVGRELIITKILIPSFIATAVTAPLMYLLTKFLSSRFGVAQNDDLEDAVEEAVEKAEERRNNRSKK